MKKNLVCFLIFLQFNSCFVFFDKRDKHLKKIKNDINIEIDFIYSNKRFIFEINSKNEINMFNLNLIITDTLGNKKFQKFFRKEISNKFLYIEDTLLNKIYKEYNKYEHELFKYKSALFKYKYSGILDTTGGLLDTTNIGEKIKLLSEKKNNYRYLIDSINNEENVNVSLSLENYLYFKNNEYTTKEDIDNFFKNKKEYRKLILKKCIVILEYDTYEYDSLLNRRIVKDSVIFTL